MKIESKSIYFRLCRVVGRSEIEAIVTASVNNYNVSILPP